MLRLSHPCPLSLRVPGRAPALLVWLCLAAVAPAEQPLHQRIDRLIAAGMPHFESQAAPPASDAEFLRRVYLDVAGTIPSAAEARAFLDDREPAKRARLIDRLLAGPDYARHLQEVFDVLLMERRPDRRVRRAEWQEYLRTSFAANKPWDQLVREILSAGGPDPKPRPAARFLFEREAEPNLVTRDISRLFLGMNLQCAQCHDHPLVEDYKQAHFYGILAFLNRTSFVTGKDGQPALAEKAEGEVSFQSVFDPAKVTKTTGPRLPGMPPVKEPKFDKGKQYLAAAGGAQPVPRFSRRAQLAIQVTDPQNILFRRCSANRFWALLLGRGLVHPLDFDHSANPPSHPELLTALADDFAARKYDVRSFLRELASSQTYQRSSELPAGVKDVPPESFAVATLKPLSPEQLAWGLMQATGLTDAERLALGKGANGQAVTARLIVNVAPFATTFGSQPGQPEGESFQATLDQALFLENGGLIRGWLAPRPGNLTDRLLRLPDATAAAEELYLSVLTRRPVEEERREVADYLRSRTKDRAAALQELAWALLASAEFRLNH